MVVVLLLCVLAYLTSEKSILYVQNLIGIPGTSIAVGNVDIKKDNDWLLVDMRSADSDVDLLYGVLPCVYFKKCQNNHGSEPFYLFSNIKHGSDIMFSESNSDFVYNLKKTFISNKSRAGWDLLEFHGYESYSVSREFKDKKYMRIIVPELMLDIIMTAKNKTGINLTQKEIRFELIKPMER